MYEIPNILVSVIIPTFNHGRYLAQCLQSVIDQTYQNFEIIIIDNNSTDNTCEVIDCYRDSRIVYLKINNKGVIANSRNTGISLAQGDWIAFLDSDDCWDKRKLAECLKKINNNVDFIYHDLLIINENKKNKLRNKVKTWQVKKPLIKDFLLNGNAVTTSSVMVRRNLMKEIGGFNVDPQMTAAEDYNAWMRISLKTDKFEYIPTILGRYRVHFQGMSQRDMSISSRIATAEFIYYLKDKEMLKYEANLKLISGSFKYSQKAYQKASIDLIYVLMNGKLRNRIKTFFLLLKITLINLKNL